MTCGRTQAAIDEAFELLKDARFGNDTRATTYYGSAAIAKLLQGLLLEVCDLRRELAEARKGSA